MDEAYIKVKGQWTYLYRAVDKEGNLAIGSNGIPDKVTMDKSGANKGGIDTINLQLALLFILSGIFAQITVRQIKYLNNIVEQDHRFVKKSIKPMKGFKPFHSAEVTLGGVQK
jgi:putative transposase